MPIPERIYVPREMNEATFLDEASVSLKWSIWPRRCSMTNKLLWFTRAYRASVTKRTGDITFTTWHRWYEKKKFILWRIKNAH